MDRNAEGDGTPRPLRSMAGRGARPQYASTAKCVLQLSADGFDGFVSATGISQIDLTAVEVGGLMCGKGQPHDGSTQLKSLQTTSDVIEDGGGMTRGRAQAKRDRLMTSVIKSKCNVGLGHGLISSDQARGEITNHRTDDEEEGLKFCDGRGKVLCDAG